METHNQIKESLQPHQTVTLSVIKILDQINTFGIFGAPVTIHSYDELESPYENVSITIQIRDWRWKLLFCRDGLSPFVGKWIVGRWEDNYGSIDDMMASAKYEIVGDEYTAYPSMDINPPLRMILGDIPLRIVGKDE